MKIVGKTPLKRHEEAWDKWLKSVRTFYRCRGDLDPKAYRALLRDKQLTQSILENTTEGLIKLNHRKNGLPLGKNSR